MKIIISPAKKMNMDDGLAWKSLPCFLEKTSEIASILQGMDLSALQKLWKCNDSLAEINYKRLENMQLKRNLTPAIISYEGIQYQYMAPSVMETEGLEYLEEHLRILSGFYGILKPFDGVTPYRLEMQAKLKVNDTKDLYAYWGASIYQKLTETDHVILNLASKEYAKCVEKYLTDEDRFVTCEFVENVNGKLVQKGTLAKMARGEMVRYLAQNNIQEVEGAKGFHALGFVFDEALSNANEFVFIKK